MDCTKFSDQELKKYQQQALKVCAFCEFGTRIGIQLPAFLEVNERTRNFIQEIEAEYFRRRPEAKNKRNQDFLQLAANLFDAKNYDDFGKDENAVSTEYFTEYNVPESGKKKVTCRKTFSNDQSETTERICEMLPVDFLFATLENAMDEFALTIPDVPEDQNK